MRLLAAVSIIFLALSAARADDDDRDVSGPTSSAGPSQFAVPISTVTSLTVPEFAAKATICIETGSARYSSDGLTAPSATIGIPVPAGTCFQFAGSLTSFRIIGGAGSTMDVEYFK